MSNTKFCTKIGCTSLADRSCGTCYALTCTNHDSFCHPIATDNSSDEAKELLLQIKEHCACTRNTIGFDYGETHKNLGKPKMGTRWLTPAEIIERALRRGKACS